MSNDSPFTVSVIIPAYNIGQYVGRAIESVLSQTYQPDEIIVIDDGSTDNTASVIQSYGSKVCYIYQENAGLSAARNTGIKAATGNWIALLDGDDEWLPDKMASQKCVLNKNPDLKWMSCNFYFRSCKDNSSSYATDSEKLKATLKENSYCDSFFTATNFGIGFAPSTFIIKRSVLLEVGLFDESLTYAEDFEMWWRIAYRWPQIGYTYEPLAVYYTQRPGSLTVETASQEIVNTFCNIFHRHWSLAAQFGQQKALKPFIRHKLYKWLYSLYRQGNFDFIHNIIINHKKLLPANYRTVMRILTRLPRFTTIIGQRIIKLFKFDK